MFSPPITTLSQVSRVRTRATRWRVHPRGWATFWKVITCISALISMVLAAVFIYLLIKLLLPDDFGYPASAWEPSWLSWPYFGNGPGKSVTVAPEPSRSVLVLVAMFAAILRRRR